MLPVPNEPSWNAMMPPCHRRLAVDTQNPLSAAFAGLKDQSSVCVAAFARCVDDARHRGTRVKARDDAGVSGDGDLRERRLVAGAGEGHSHAVVAPEAGRNYQTSAR